MSYANEAKLPGWMHGLTSLCVPTDNLTAKLSCDLEDLGRVTHDRIRSLEAYTKAAKAASTGTIDMLCLYYPCSRSGRRDVLNASPASQSQSMVSGSGEGVVVPRTDLFDSFLPKMPYVISIQFAIVLASACHQRQNDRLVLGGVE